MDQHLSIETKDAAPVSLTTGPLAASRKVYSAPETAPDVAIPFREIALLPNSGEGSFRVYDSSGPYTDAAASVDVNRGLARPREACVLERGGVERLNPRRLALLDVHDPHRRELADRLAGDRLADAEGGGDPRLRRQGVAGLQPAVLDRLGDALDHGVAQPHRHDVAASEWVVPAQQG